MVAEKGTFPGRLYDKGRENLHVGILLSLSPNGIAPVVQVWALEPGASFFDLAGEVLAVAYQILNEGGGILVTCPDAETVSEMRSALLIGLDVLSGDCKQMAQA